MKTPFFYLAAFLGIFVCVSLACNIPSPSGRSELRSVSVSPSSGSGKFNMMVSYVWRLGDPGYSVSCYFPGPQGQAYSMLMPLTHDKESIEYDFVVEKPDTYVVSCMDNISQSVSTQFKVVEPPAPPEKPETKPETKPEAANPGSFKMPKPGDFNSAGMWMYFDEGTSSNPAISVPRQCLPGVNYTHAGGTSSFDIDKAGNMVGACQLSYFNGAMRLTGSMKGTWDGQKDELTFHLETLTESDSMINGKAGISSNKTIYEGTARFNSAVQASGTATWQTQGSASASGTVPFVINFNPK